MFIFGPIRLFGLYSSQELAHRRLADLNEFFFGVIMVMEGLAVLTLTPALVAGAIAEEKQRRGFDIVLTTTLSSFEIVLGKLLARMCQSVVMLSFSIGACLLSAEFERRRRRRTRCHGLRGHADHRISASQR